MSLEKQIEASLCMIQSRVGENGKVIVLVSGGVDGMVSAALLLRALPVENIYAIHVDHGFMRKNESKSVGETLHKFGFKNLLIVNAQDKFINALTNITEPEEKRQIIGNLFIEVVKEAADTFNLDYDTTFIAQGTLKPDLIESGNADVSDKMVKTHHNDVDIVRKARAKGLIIETNAAWYKEDVRAVARILGIGEETASRQPFPGPGLAVRIICANKPQDISEDKKNKFAEFMKDKKVSGIIAPILSVGVESDMRSYKNLAVLYGDTDFDKIVQITKDIPDNLDFINRCAYILNKKSIDNLICNKLSMSAENAELIRGIDYIITSEINRFIKESGKKITQCFGVLLPVSSGGSKKYSAVIRAFITTDFMTGHAALPGRDISVEVLQTIAEKITAEHSEIDLVLYDMTGKPSATVEWE